jgi:hypothetical protein
MDESGRAGSSMELEGRVPTNAKDINPQTWLENALRKLQQ